LRSAEYAVSYAVFWILEGGGNGENNASEFGARDPGERGLMLVFSTDLEEVEKIGRGGVDSY
jgi:hypothetical protein